MKTLIAIPCMDMMPMKFVACLIALQPVGWPCARYFEASSLIYDSRNKLARAAIEADVDRVLWLDSDMEFEPDLMIRLNNRIEEGRDFVSGLYMSRKKPIRPVIFKDIHVEDTPAGKKAVVPSYEDYPENEIFEVEACGFGAVMTTGKLLRDVTEKYGLPFTPVMGYGEDIAFCFRARELGYKVWCDSSIELGHIGTKTYTVDDRTQYPTACEEFKSY